MLSVAPAGGETGSTSISGNLSRAKEETKTFNTDTDHLQNVGAMIEAMENTLRSDMDGERGQRLIGSPFLFWAPRVWQELSSYSRFSVLIFYSYL